VTAQFAGSCLPGQPWPLGATAMRWRGQAGVNLAVHAPHAQRIDWCLFDASGAVQTACLALPLCTDGIWHGFVPGMPVGQLYGLRAHGPYSPAAGHRFNAHKLLIDPYARELVGSVATLSQELGYTLDASGQQQPDAQDNASRIPKARVIDLAHELQAGAAIAPGPGIALADMVLYEAHVKGLTQLHPELDANVRGTYAALASEPVLAHWRRLGINTLCLLPVQLHISEKHLLDRGLVNYWGYNTLGYFMPEPSYANGNPAAVREAFRAMVDTLHRHGFEVVLDVVYNHTAESDALGPTLSWRGLDNASAYAHDGAGNYQNPTGCGNALNAGETSVVQLVMDSLRWWVQAFGVDGFRFDLATTLGRDPARQFEFNRHAALLTAMAQDPVLANVKRIAEPWDIGAGGYQLGGFPAGWQEWNDQFRDTTRAYWLGHACTRGQFALRLSGSSDRFNHHGRSPTASINLITSHDGFTLADLTAYRDRHNLANGEDNRDGHSHNLSAHAGVEGPSDDPQVVFQRALWRRALLATLFLAQGTPQLLAGDELGHSQGGNNNAYCQDNPTTWLDWARADTDLIAYVAGLIALRRRLSGLRHPGWFQGVQEPDHSSQDKNSGVMDWRKPDGGALSQADWQDPNERALACFIEVFDKDHSATERVLLLFNPGHTPMRFELPEGAWKGVLNTATAEFDSCDTFQNACHVNHCALRVLLQSVNADAQETSP
jgi:glycogen debranching enzyme